MRNGKKILTGCLLAIAVSTLMVGCGNNETGCVSEAKSENSLHPVLLCKTEYFFEIFTDGITKFYHNIKRAWRIKMGYDKIKENKNGYGKI